MGLFKKSDPQAALQRAEELLRVCEAKSAELAEKRVAALPEGDLREIAALDKQLADLRQQAAILNDRVVLAYDAIRQQRHEAREAEKAAAVEAIAKKLKVKIAAAERFELQDRTIEAMAIWPEQLLGPWGHFYIADTSAIALAGVFDAPVTAFDIKLREVSARMGPIAAPVAASAAEMIKALRDVPLPEEQVGQPISVEEAA